MKKKSMSIEEFLKRLKKTRSRHWHVNTNLKMITGKDKGCPITAVEGSGIDSSEFYMAARNLRLHYKRAGRIVDAADHVPGHDKKLRKQLLDALGLKEKK